MTELEKAAREYAKRTSERTGEESTNVDDLIAFQAGAEWKSEQSPWISVEDRKPKEGERVWVKCNRFNNLPLFYSVGRFCTRLKGGYCDDSITHWMPIPE